MIAYRVPLVPLVTIRATYDCAYWPDECSRCGAETRDADGAELDYRGPHHHGGGPACPTCGPGAVAALTLAGAILAGRR